MCYEVIVKLIEFYGYLINCVDKTIHQNIYMGDNKRLD